MPTNYRFRDPNSSYQYDFLFDDVFVPYYLFPQNQGNLLTWGRNSSNTGKAILGTNDKIDRSIPVTTFAGGNNWVQVSCGYANTAAIKTDGTLWVWGDNSYLQLGITASGDCRSTPVTTFAGGTNWKDVSCGADHLAAIKTDGTLWVWGDNGNGQLGLNAGAGGSNPQKCTPVTTFAGGTNWAQVSCGYNITAGIKDDGTLWIWGRNGYGQLGDNTTIDRSTPVTTFAGGTNWKQVSCGVGQMTVTDMSVAAIKTDGTLWTWGINNNGQLGDNTTINRSTPVTTFAGGNDWKQVSCGMGQVAAIKYNGTLWGWGLNTYLQVGDTTAVSRSTPVTTFAGGTNWKQVACGQLHTLAIKTDGTLWVWGYNAFGALGNNNTTEQSTPVTTFAGGHNWKQISTTRQAGAIQYQFIDYLTN